MIGPSRLTPSSSGALDRSERRAVAADRLGEAEVEDLHGSVRRDLDVRGLQVAVDDALVVRDFEGLGDLPRDAQYLCERQSATVLGSVLTRARAAVRA